ncbi:hypothetical protein CI740_24155 [Klebsiella pneumoniae subsp. pneumoniae]|nr:hypothetical protein CI740_24155 [Klebsiella pneumoniae subsp. pneumoniae]
MELTISFSTILAASLGFIGVYVLMPIVLIARDYMAMLFMERFIANESFWSNVSDLARDKARYNSLYGEKLLSPRKINDDVKFLFGEDEITQDKYTYHEKNKDMLQKRISALEYKVQTRINLCGWIERHFKLKESIEAHVNEVTDDAYKNELLNMSDKC